MLRRYVVRATVPFRSLHTSCVLSDAFHCHDTTTCRNYLIRVSNSSLNIEKSLYTPNRMCMRFHRPTNSKSKPKSPKQTGKGRNAPKLSSISDNVDETYTPISTEELKKNIQIEETIAFDARKSSEMEATAPILPPLPTYDLESWENVEENSVKKDLFDFSSAQVEATDASPITSLPVDAEGALSYMPMTPNYQTTAAVPSLGEGTLIYNPLIGRMCSRNAYSLECLRKIGFGVNDKQQVYVESPGILNAFAAEVRQGKSSIPSHWPVSIIRAIGIPLRSKAIADPADAIQKLMTLKLNNLTRSNYSSGVVLGENMEENSPEKRAHLLDELEDPTKTIELNEEQEKVIDLALKGYHMYIGGSAGTGKTVLLRAMSRRLQAQRLRVAMTATTGVAGCHVGGSTLHHTLGILPNGEFLKRSVMLDFDVIIIDEVSMLSRRVFEKLDRVLREEAGTPDTPFGGVQLILSGDFLQLSCVHEEGIIHSNIFNDNFLKLSLRTVVRQASNTQFAEDLRSLRVGKVPENLNQTIKMLPPGTMVESAVNLLPTNKEAQIANEKELSRLEGEPITFIPEAGLTSLQCETTVTLLLRTTSEFKEDKFAQEIRSLLQSSLSFPRASLLSLYRVYEDGHAMRVILPLGESVAWREAMKEKFIEISGMIDELRLGATVTDILPTGDGLHTPESEEYLQGLMSKHPIAQPVTLKKGCRVLLRANLSSKLVNGSIGTVVGFEECRPDNISSAFRNERVDEFVERYRLFCYTECGMPIPTLPVVEFYNGEKVVIPPWEFTVGGGSYTQYYSLSTVALPITLAYAFTVHKVQGLTLVGRVHLELSRMWPCEHLLYVAMSRVRNPDQLSMSSFSSEMIVANPDCVSFDSSLPSAAELQEEIAAKELLILYPDNNNNNNNNTDTNNINTGNNKDSEAAANPDECKPQVMPSRLTIASWKRCDDALRAIRQRGALHLAAASFPAYESPRKTTKGRSSSKNNKGVSNGQNVVPRPALTGAAAAVENEYLRGIEQSVIVSRRMRKLVQHATRAGRLQDIRKKGTPKRPMPEKNSSADKADDRESLNNISQTTLTPQYDMNDSSSEDSDNVLQLDAFLAGEEISL